ncbi:unnamed protein product, partial [Mesorhabditis belari]|uniref:V-SNARE coiled-coil homology domain-containing protein n=1 Tax=Mesorhabditis belari TaxID=2138241 RepID=A0AAF3F7Q3_9BILA
MHRLFDIPNTRIGITQTSSTLSAQASNLHPTDEKIMQARAQVNEVMDLMRENIGKLAKRGERLDNLAERAEALEAGTNDFYKTAVQVKRDRYWKAYSMYLAMLGTFAVFVIAGTTYYQM